MADPVKTLTYGVKETQTSSHLKVYVSQAAFGNNKQMTVVGYIGEGSSQELQSNWNSPFEGDTIGGMFEKLSGLAQNELNLTTTSRLNSLQVWQGNMPDTQTIAMLFIAHSNAKAEVENAIAALKMMASPELTSGNPVDGNPFGRPPQSVTIDIGRKLVLTDCKIVSVSSPYDVPKTKAGDRIHALVNITIEPMQMLNKSDYQRTLL